MPDPLAAPGHSAASPFLPREKGLKAGALGLLSTVVIGVSSTAPAYGIAATVGLIAAAVGLQSPAIMLVAFVPMLCIAVAYRALNAAEPDCGTTFTWAARAFGSRTGWMGGWGIIAADVIVMANLAQIAGQYSFLLVGADGLAANAGWTTLAGLVWIAALTWVSYRGIELSARLQFLLLALEITVLLVFAVVALVKVYTGHAAAGAVHPQLSWLNPFAISSGSALSAGVLLAVFIYWGWDAALAVNEETRDAARTPGRAGVISTLILVVLFVLLTVACVSYGGVSLLTNPANQGDVLAVLANQVFGSTWGKLLILATLSSAAASTQTTIMPTARTTLSMAAYRAIPAVFARIHPRYLTPSIATIVMGTVSAVFFAGVALLNHGRALGDVVGAVGLLIAFYYAMTGYACVWYFRRELRHDLRAAITKGLLPLIGTATLTWAFVTTAKDSFASSYGITSLGGVGGVFIIGIGSLVVGALLMLAWAWHATDYFHGDTLDAPLIDPNLGLPAHEPQQAARRQVSAATLDGEQP